MYKVYIRRIHDKHFMTIGERNWPVEIGTLIEEQLACDMLCKETGDYEYLVRWEDD